MQEEEAYSEFPKILGKQKIFHKSQPLFFPLRIKKNISAQKIQRAWLSHMDKTIFQLLKHTICAAVCIFLFVFSDIQLLVKLKGLLSRNGIYNLFISPI